VAGNWATTVRIILARRINKKALGGKWEGIIFKNFRVIDFLLIVYPYLFRRCKGIPCYHCIVSLANTTDLHKPQSNTIR